MGRISHPTEGFGGRIRQRRLAMGLTQAQLAEKTAITSGYIAKIELGHGTPSHVVITRLWKVMDLRAVDLTLASGFIPDVVQRAFLATPEAVLWFARLSPNRRRRLRRSLEAP